MSGLDVPAIHLVIDYSFLSIGPNYKASSHAVSVVAGVASAIVVKLQKKIVSFYSRDLDLNTPSARSRRSSCVNGAAGFFGTDDREPLVLSVLALFL